MRLEALADVLYPAASPEWRALGASYVRWIYVTLEELALLADEEKVRARTEELRRPSSGILAETLGRLVTDFARLSPPHAPRFIGDVGAYLEAFAWKAANRQEGLVPDATSFRRMRPHMGGMWGALRMALASEALPPEAEEDPVLADLFENAVWMPCLAHDLVLAEPEGDLHNAVLLHMRHNGVAFEAARRRLARQLEEEQVSFYAALKRLKGSLLSSRQAAAVAAVVHGVTEWVRRHPRRTLKASIS